MMNTYFFKCHKIKMITFVQCNIFERIWYSESILVGHFNPGLLIPRPFYHELTNRGLGFRSSWLKVWGWEVWGWSLGLECTVTKLWVYWAACLKKIMTEYLASLCFLVTPLDVVTHWSIKLWFLSYYFTHILYHFKSSAIVALKSDIC